MVPDDDIGAGLYQRVPDLDLILGQAILKARTPEGRHTPMQRQDDKIGVSAGGFNRGDRPIQIFSPGARADVRRAARLLQARRRIEMIGLGDANRRDAGPAIGRGRSGTECGCRAEKGNSTIAEGDAEDLRAPGFVEIRAGADVGEGGCRQMPQGIKECDFAEVP